MESSVLIFPLRNEQGFRVDSMKAYAHMISTIVRYSTELTEDYPNHHIWVVYEVNDGD